MNNVLYSLLIFKVVKSLVSTKPTGTRVKQVLKYTLH